MVSRSPAPPDRVPDQGPTGWGPSRMTMVLAMVFVGGLTVLGHDPHMAVMEILALLAGLSALRNG